MTGKILLVDDDALILNALECQLSEDYSIVTSTTIAGAKSVLLKEEIDVAVVDLNFEGQAEDGLALIDFINRERPKTAIIVLSGDISTSRVSNAMRRPLVDFVVKDGDIDEILRIAIERGMERRRLAVATRGQFQYQTRSPEMRRVLNVVERIVKSPNESPILIQGEAGTGKEHIAKHIGAVAKKSVVTTSMANHSVQIADSALFGHVKGAFTGADSNQIGWVEKAHNGILFLDEIGEAPIEIQAKLLRVVQEKEFTSVGSTAVKRVNVRFIAATNRNLQAMANSGSFKKDLLERLSTWVLKIPPLRERPEDIEFLSRVFLADLAGDSAFQVTPEGLQELLAYDWPGNIRELRNVIERITTLTDSRTLDREAVRFGITQSPGGDEDSTTSSHQPLPISRAQAVSALDACQGNRSRAAKLLGVHPTTLFRRLRHWGLQNYDGVQGRPRTPKEREIG